MIRATVTLEIDDRAGHGLTEGELRRALVDAIDDRVVRDRLCVTIGHTADVKVERLEQT